MNDQLLLLDDLTPDYDACSGSGPIYSDELIIEEAFQWYRAHGFPYRALPRHVCLQEINRLACAPSDTLLHTTIAYQVADTYHPHRFHGAVRGKISPVTAFGMDDKFRRALRLELTTKMIHTGYVNMLSLVAGTQAHSNFRPGFACLLYRQYCQPGAVVLDTSTGYGGRLVGFLASGIAGHYIGIDPSSQTHTGNQRMIKDLNAGDKVTLYHLPAEEVPHAWVRGQCDFCFTSPPYFTKEHYSEEPTQAWKRYPEAAAWQEGFLLPMMQLQEAALKPSGFALVNIEDVTIGRQRYPVAQWCLDAAQRAGLVHRETQRFPLQRRMGKGHTDTVEKAYESVLIFQKPPCHALCGA